MIIKLGRKKLELLRVALRYCELNHPYYKKEFKKFLNLLDYLEQEEKKGLKQMNFFEDLTREKNSDIFSYK